VKGLAIFAIVVILIGIALNGIVVWANGREVLEFWAIMVLVAIVAGAGIAWRLKTD
jgi:hypothetical protein